MMMIKSEFLLGVLLYIIMYTKSGYAIGSFDKHSNYEFEKYSAGLNKNFKIPTLENLFQKVTFWDMNNMSSPCQHYGKKRATLCHKVVSFDRDGYEKSLQDTRKLILSRLNLKQEPQIKINKNTLNFIDQLENRILNEQDKVNRYSTMKTKYDMKEPQTKTFNSMHEAVSITENCPNQNIELKSDSLCVNFNIPVRNFVYEKNGEYIQRRTTSIVLWLFMRTFTLVHGQNVKIQVQNLNTHTKKGNIVTFKHVLDGWNTVNITNIFKFNTFDLPSEINNTINVSFLIKCLNKMCAMEYSNTNEFTEMAQNIELNDDEFNQRDLLVLSNGASKKPLLSINIRDDLETSKPKTQQRVKRKVSYSSGRGHNNHINYKAFGAENISPNHCSNNYPDPDKECCLITYFVNFHSLKWSSWILSPPGFIANYCSGKCNDAKSK